MCQGEPLAISLIMGQNNVFDLFVSSSLSLCMSQLLPKSLDGGSGSWWQFNISSAYIPKVGYAGYKNPQMILNFPQRDCLRTRKVSKLANKPQKTPGSSFGFRRVNRFLLLVLRAWQKQFTNMFLFLVFCFFELGVERNRNQVFVPEGYPVPVFQIFIPAESGYLAEKKETL